MDSQGPEGGRRCAVVVNPVKIRDDFRSQLLERLSAAGFDEPLWLETSVDDPGRAMTQQALASGPDLVIGAGGDGTIRVVADQMAGSGVPMGIVAAGTANLLARNLELPLSQPQALDVAVAGRTQDVDLILLTVDDRPPEHFAVMAGVGVDAVIMDEVDDELKAKVGAVAYFLTAGKALGRLPVRMDIRVDGGRRHRRSSVLCLIGNVGKLPGGMVLLPEADARNGRLDVYVASPHRVRHWLQLLVRLITRRKRADDPVDTWQGRSVEVQLAEPDSYQLDGDVVGTCTRMRAEVRPAALRVCIP